MLKKSSDTHSIHKEFSLIFFSISISIFIFYSYQYIIRLLPNAIKPDLEQSYNISNIQFGSFAGTYYIGYVLLHIPLGVMISRIGAKVIVSSSLALSGLGLLPLIYEWDWSFVIWGRFISGIGSSCAAVAGFQIFRQIYPDKYARMVGYMMFFGICTAKLSEQYLSVLFYEFQVANVLAFLLFFALCISLILFIIFPKLEMKTDRNILYDIKEIIQNKNIIFLSICAALMIGSLEGFSDAWGSAFLMQLYPNVNKIQADYLVSFIFIGMAAGNLILPYIADRYNMSYLVALISAIGMSIALFVIILCNLTEQILILLFIIIGFFCAYQASTIAMIAKHAPSNKAGLTATFVNMVIMSFASIFHRIISFGIDITLKYNFDSTTAYKVGMSFIPISSFIAFTCLLIFVMQSKARSVKIVDTYCNQ